MTRALRLALGGAWTGADWRINDARIRYSHACLTAAVATNGVRWREIATVVDDLIIGLKADGIWSKLDRLWIYAAENTASALTDLKTGALATTVSSPTFDTTNFRGYIGNGAGYIQSGLASNFGTGNYAQNSACFFGWSNTSGIDGGGLIGTGATALTSCILPEYTDTNVYAAINTGQTHAYVFSGLTNPSAATGLYLINRSGSTASTLI